MRALRPVPSFPLRWLAVLLVPAAVACGGGGGGGTTSPGFTKRDVTMPPTAPGDPSAPWSAPAASALSADPGPDRSVDAGAHVALDGSRSRSPAGSITAFGWVQVAGTTVTLTGAATARPEFDAPAVSGRTEQLAFELTVHDGTGASTTATHRVAVHDPVALGSVSGVATVRAAIQSGGLDRDTAGQYVAFAAFGDPRLPAQYRGTVPEESASWALAYLRREYPTLSPAAQSVVLPFLLPPGHPARTASLGAGAASIRAAAPAPPEQLGIEGAHVVVWYWSDMPGGGTVASNLLDEIEGVIWPKLLQVWRSDHMPLLADGAVGAAFRGIHGKLNVFLDTIQRDPNLAGALGYQFDYGNGLEAAPGYVVLRQNLAWSGKSPPGLIEVAAHEITHACQSSYDRTEDYADRRFLYEAIATWAVDDVYPTGNAEHRRAKDLMDVPHLPIDDDSNSHPYGGYLFFQWYTRAANDRDFVRRTFANFQSVNSIEAVENAFPEYDGTRIGLEFNWGSFLESLWNGDPTRNFWAVDGLEKGAKLAEPVRTLTLGGAPEATFSMDADVAYLSGEFHRFTVAPDVRTIHFYDGLANDLQYVTGGDGTTLISMPNPPPAEWFRSATTRVLVKRASGWSHPQVAPGVETTGQNSLGSVSFCQDDPDDAVQEIVVAFGDSKPQRGHSMKPKGIEPLLWLTNIGCFQWRGSVTATTSPSATNSPTETVSATNVLWTSYVPNGVKTGATMFQVQSAQVSWSMSGQVDNCTYSGSDSWTAGPTAYGPSGLLVFEPRVTSGGIYRTYEAGASGPHEVTYTIECISPDGTTTSTHTKPIDWLATARHSDRHWRPSVSANGEVAADTADDGSMVYTWSFQREAGFTPLP